MRETLACLMKKYATLKVEELAALGFGLGT
jgi:hypothetical protein